jgi:hypothetical protein
MMSKPSSKLQCTIAVNDLNECELLCSQLLDEDNSPKFNLVAQAAADLDNLQSAFQHLDGSHPVTINTDKAMENVKNKLFPNPPPNDLFPLPGQPATCPPGFHQNLIHDNNKFVIAACYATNQNWYCIRTICLLSGSVSILCTNSFPVLWT